MIITPILKPKTVEGKRPEFIEQSSLHGQTLDKYNFHMNSKPYFYFNSSFKADETSISIKKRSQSSNRREYLRAITSQSTKNSSRINTETITSFLNENSSERAKTQSMLFRACQRKQQIGSNLDIPKEINGENENKSRKIFTSSGNLVYTNAQFYEKKSNDRKFFLPSKATFTKRMNYKTNENKANTLIVLDEKIKKAQKNFIQTKFFDDSDPYISYIEKNMEKYVKENIISERQEICSNVVKKLLLNKHQSRHDEINVFNESNTALHKKFKMNSIIKKIHREVSQTDLLYKRIKPKLLVQKNIPENCDNRKLFLVIENLYLDEGIKNKLKFCYTYFNFVFN